MSDLQTAIRRNRRREKYKRLRRKLWLKVYEYQDAGKEAKYTRILQRIATLCK